jgi:type II secretory pathway component GspD/PulD (secretin)
MTPRATTGLSLLCLAIISTAISLSLCAGSTVAQGDTGPAVEASEDNLVTIRTKDASLPDLLNMLSQAADIKIIFGDDITGFVTLNLPEVSVEDALNAVVAQQGYVLTRMPGDIYVVSREPLPVEGPAIPKPVEPASRAEEGPDIGSASAAPGPEPISDAPPGDQESSALDVPPGFALPEPPEGRPPRQPVRLPGKVFTVDAIQVNYADPAQIALMFGGTVAGSSPDIFLGQRHTGRVARSSSRPWGMTTASRGPAGYFGSLSPANMRGDSWAESFRQLGGALGGGGLGGYGGGMTGGGLGLGRGGIGGVGLGGTGTGGFTSLLPEDISAVTAFLDDNSLLVRGTAEAIDQFREIIALLDKPAKQVEVSVKFVSITTTFEEAFGIDWAIKNTKIEVFNQGFAPPQAVNSVVRFATGNLDAQLNALVKSSRATVISEPRVATTNNMFASVEFSTEIPFFAATVSYNNYGVRTVDFQPDFVPVENYLDVMPRVNADDSITLMLMPNISNVAGYVEGPNGERIPIATYQNVFTQLTVKDGETAVIGGLITKDDSTTKLHTPLLSKIPIIGKLFDSRAKNLNDTELLIFVTPRILREVTVG